MLTYVENVIPNLSTLTQNLRNLTKSGANWLWTNVHDKEFDFVVRILSEDPILQFFQEGEEITLSVDRSKYGMGAVILQKGKPVAYASKSLTETQQRYAQIEKEMLPIPFEIAENENYFAML